MVGVVNETVYDRSFSLRTQHDYDRSSDWDISWCDAAQLYYIL